MVRGLLVILSIAACDSRATSAPSGGGTSREYESCGASADCKDELRCFDHTCRRSARSTVGDYYAAAGALALKKGDVEGAIAQYAQALGHYDAEKVALPPDVDCAYGAALAAATSNKEHLELGARVLHRCVLAVPAGARLRDQALATLATLGDAGLDPVLLGANKTADLYLTKAPTRPSNDKLAITVTANPAQTNKTFTAIADKVKDPDVRNALIACWDAGKKDTLTVTVPLKIGYTPSEYEDEAGTYSVKLEPAAANADPADACVRQVLEPMIKGLKLSDAFTTKLTINIK